MMPGSCPKSGQLFFWEKHEWCAGIFGSGHEYEYDLALILWNRKSNSEKEDGSENYSC